MEWLGENWFNLNPINSTDLDEIQLSTVNFIRSLGVWVDYLLSITKIAVHHLC